MTAIIYPLLVTTLLGFTPDRPDLTTLSPTQRQTFERVTSEEFCDCTSSLSLAGCLDLRKDCPMANHLASLVFDTAKDNNSADAILGFLSARVFGQYCARPKTITPGAVPAKGNPKGPITVVQFADFRCSHCKEEAPRVKEAIERFGKHAKFVFLPFPLQNHPLSMAAAEALLAAGAQGRYWEMHDLLFENQASDFSEATLLRLGRQLKLNMKRFSKALTTHQYKDQVMHYKQMGLDAGVISTPGFFINGRYFSANSPAMTLTRRLDMELDRNRGNCQ
jgi:protein-disulfide isomerase